MLTLKNNETSPLYYSYVNWKEGLEQEILLKCEFEGMKVQIETFKSKKKKVTIFVLIEDTENNKSELSFLANTENKLGLIFAELPEKTIKKEKYVQLEVIPILPHSTESVCLKHNYKKSDSETNKEWLKDACAKIISEVLLEEKCEKNKQPFDVKEFEALSERLNGVLKDAYINREEEIKAKNAERLAKENEKKLKDEAAKELSEITGVTLYIDPMSCILKMPELRYNITTYDEQLERRFVDYKEGMSMKDFLLTKFGEKAVSAAERAFGLKTE